MKLTWYGHACFKLETADGSVVFDPYQNEYLPNLTLPEITADAVICSHGHGDHSAAELITLTGKEPSFKLTQIPCFHDEVCGLKRGKNLITIVEAEGLRLAHFGDLGHGLTRGMIKEIGHLDALMIPVGGVYTVDAKATKKICDEIKPGVIIPMHYRTGNAGLQNVAPLEDFLSLFPESEVLQLGKSSWDVEKNSASVVVFELC